MKVKFKKLHPDCKIPTKGRKGDAGYDLFPLGSGSIIPGSQAKIELGFATEFDPDYVALIWDRGSTGLKGLAKHAGVVDANWRGEWVIALRNHGDILFEYSPEKAIAQVIFQRHITCDFVEVEELSNSNRGTNWNGSSDKEPKT